MTSALTVVAFPSEACTQASEIANGPIIQDQVDRKTVRKIRIAHPATTFLENPPKRAVAIRKRYRIELYPKDRQEN
eukprot:2556021-Rhodomonas_salina.1